MKATKFLSICATTLLLSGWGLTPVQAEKHPSSGETTQTGNMGCGGALCVDIYKMKCTSSTTAHADVTDDGTLDDVLSVSLVGIKPTKAAGQQLLGTGSQQLTSVGGSTPSYAEVLRPTASTIEALVLISNLSSGGTDYHSDIHCHGPAGVFNPASLSQTQNE